MANQLIDLDCQRQKQFADKVQISNQWTKSKRRASKSDLVHQLSILVRHGPVKAVEIRLVQYTL
jgi:hypothetical protein